MDTDSLLVTVDRCMSKIQSLAAVGAPHSSRVNAEQAYKLAYAACVRAGLRPRLRLKYRSGTAPSQAGGHNNNASSMGKHVAHPQVFGFKRNKYRCDPRWNPAEKVA